MSKKVLTLDLTTGQEQLVTQVVDTAPATDVEKQEVSYSVKAVDEQVSAISTAIDGVKAAVLGSSYQNAVKQAVADVAARDVLTLTEGDRVLVGNDIHIKTSSGFTVITAKAGMAFVNLADNKEYFFDGTSWKDKLGEAISALDAGLVHKTGDETIAGNKTFSNDVTVQGNLTVTGTTTSVDTVNLVIKDNIITLNDSEPADHAGVTTGKSGFEINRGSEAKANFYFDEADDLFKSGITGVEKIVARIDDANTVSTSETYSASKIEAIKLALQGEIKAASPTNTFKAANPIAVGQVVYISGDNLVDVADNTNTAIYNKIAGIAVSAAAKDEEVKVARIGKLSGFSGLTSGQTLYLGTAGQLVNSAVGAKVFNIIATAVDATTILLAVDSSILM